MKLRFTPLFVVGLIAANTAAGTWRGRLPRRVLARHGLSPETVGRGEVRRLVTATFLSHDRAMLLRQIPFAALVLGAYEWREGWKRTALTFFGLDIGATVLALGMLGSSRIRTSLDVGMSAGGFGLLGALMARHPRGGLGLATVLAVVGAKTARNPDPIADAVHGIGVVMGFALERARL